MSINKVEKGVNIVNVKRSHVWGVQYLPKHLERVEWAELPLFKLFAYPNSRILHITTSHKQSSTPNSTPELQHCNIYI